MSQIPPIEDAYIDDVIKVQAPFNPNLNKTQGTKLRELFKLLRDRYEQEITAADNKYIKASPSTAQNVNIDIQGNAKATVLRAIDGTNSGTVYPGGFQGTDGTKIVELNGSGLYFSLSEGNGVSLSPANGLLTYYGPNFKSMIASPDGYTFDDGAGRSGRFSADILTAANPSGNRFILGSEMIVQTNGAVTKALLSNYNGAISTMNELPNHDGRLATIKDIPNLTDYQTKTEKGATNGYAALDANGKVPVSQMPDALVGAVVYLGSYDADSNTPSLPSASDNKGKYFVVSISGVQQGIHFENGDWIISNGTIWQKVDNRTKVASVDGQTGAIVLSGKYIQANPSVPQNVKINLSQDITATELILGSPDDNRAGSYSKDTLVFSDYFRFREKISGNLIFDLGGYGAGNGASVFRQKFILVNSQTANPSGAPRGLLDVMGDTTTDDLTIAKNPDTAVSNYDLLVRDRETGKVKKVINKENSAALDISDNLKYSGDKLDVNYGAFSNLRDFLIAFAAEQGWGGTTIPLDKTAVTFDNITANQIGIKWIAVNHATSYVVKRGSTIVYTGSALSFIDTGLAPSTSYGYTVTASSNGYISSVSNVASKSTLSATPSAYQPVLFTHTYGNPVISDNNVSSDHDGDIRTSSDTFIAPESAGIVQANANKGFLGLATSTFPASAPEFKHGITRADSGKVISITSNNYFSDNVITPTGTIVRMNADGINMKYEYSTDNGATWVTMQTVLQDGSSLYIQVSFFENGQSVNNILALI